MSVDLSGEAKDLIAFSGMDLKLDGSGTDLSEVGPIIGRKLPATGEFTVKGRLTGSAKFLLMKELSAIVDKSDFKGMAKIEFRKRPKITVRLKSSVIDFTALMKSLEKDEQKTANKIVGQVYV